MKLGKKKDKEPKKNDDFLAQEAAEDQATANEYTLDIPEDEIWTYQIEGLQAPHINKPFKNAKIKKIIVVIALVVSIGLAMMFSFEVLSNDTFKYKELDDGTYELVRFSNTIDLTEITVDYVVEGFETNKKGDPDYSKPIKNEDKVISKIGEYAFNSDDYLRVINIGKGVKEIDGKSIYSCWNIRSVYVDEENPYLCDIDGVLYDKDVTTLIHFPNNHRQQLRINNDYAYVDSSGEVHSKLYEDKNPNNKEGLAQADVEMAELWGTTNRYNEAFYQEYNKKTRTYVVPSTVKVVGELGLAYSHLVDIYLPEGLERLESMALFKNDNLVNIYSYRANEPITDTTYKSIEKMVTIYPSLPDGLKYIGSDCMQYIREVHYMYIPSSIIEIGHHALWDSALKNDDGSISGVSLINTGLNEDQFESNVTQGQQWKPEYDYMLFKKSVDMIYAAQREPQTMYNVHRQYYWAVQWAKNHTPQTKEKDKDALYNLTQKDREKVGFIIKDLDNKADGIPELIIRQYNFKEQKLETNIYTFRDGYLAQYAGSSKYTNDEFIPLCLDDKDAAEKALEQENAALDALLAE